MNYKCALIFIFSVASLKLSAQPGEWVWLRGDSVPFGWAVYGIQGIPGPNNNPPALYEPCEWTDLNGNFWLYGGLSGGSDEHGDLWKYDPIIDQWTWMKGTGVVNDPGSYGTMGVSTPANLPPARAWGITTWIDDAGDLWMFGGGAPGNMSDLWKYNIATNQWTWMKGPTSAGISGVFGSQGIPDPNNNPDPRSECASAWSLNDQLWLFGGYPGSKNDLWRYNISSNEWTWMHGSALSGQTGSYGTLGVESSTNVPGARHAYAHWMDNAGYFYMLGGRNNSMYNDFWRYNTQNNMWTWIGGPDFSSHPGQYNTKCFYDPSSIPSARFENRTVATDQFNNFWMFGGAVQNLNSNLNDLWMFCLSNQQWIWVSGDSTSSPVSNYGVRGVSDPANIPRGKAGAVMWNNNSGHLYVYGGHSGGGQYNDLWKYTIDYSCVQCSQLPVAGFTAPNAICPGTCTDFSNSSQNATAYQWLFPGGNPPMSTDVNPADICYITPGSYDVTLIATNAIGSDTVILSDYISVYPFPPAQGILQSGDTLFANPGAVSYQWYYEGNIIPGATEYFYIAFLNGNYNVVATDQNGCEVEAGIFDVIAIVAPLSEGDPVVWVFPNPAQQNLLITNSRPGKNISATIYNSIGEVVQSLKIENSSTEFTIDIKELPAGTYVIQLHSGKEIFRDQFIKQ